MKNQYYLKDKKINLITKTTEQDPLGQWKTVYKYLANNVWAYATQLSQDQVFTAAQYGEDESRFFVLNHRSDLDLYDFVEYRGKFYTITRVDTKDDYNGDLFIYAKDTPKGDTPKNIQPADA